MQLPLEPANFLLMDEEYKEFWTKKSLEISLSSTYLSLLRNSTCSYNQFSNFSSLFHSFDMSFSSLKIAPLSKDTNHLYEYVDCFKSETTYRFVNLERFKKMMKGYLY